jgi:hypothetical protein
MGRPPIGKVAMTNTERSRRRRAALAASPHATKPTEPATKPYVTEPPAHATKPGPDPRDAEIARLTREVAQAKARIAELERERAERTAVPQAKSPDEARGRPVKRELIGKFIRMIGDPSENEARLAGERLVGALAASKDTRHALADLWDQHCEAERKRPTMPQPIDWPKIEATLVAYADGKTKLGMNAVLKAVKAAEPAADRQDREGNQVIHHHIILVLQRLGFTLSASGLTFHR